MENEQDIVEDVIEFRTYKVKLTSVSPLLMHQDNLLFNEDVAVWLSDPENKKNSTAGDDRTPAWRWIGYTYFHGGKVVIPSDNLMTMLREGGAKCGTGKGKGSFKSMTQSGVQVNEMAWVLNGPKGPIDEAPIRALIGNKDFNQHIVTARDLGFELFMKRAKIGTAKHIRVRPRIEQWSIEGTMTVTEEMITTTVLQNILSTAGKYAGLCDWRPSSKQSPGAFGRFTAEVIEIK